MEKSRTRPTRTDIAAVGIFCALAALLLTAAFYQDPTEDEMFYYTLAQRFTQGDRMLTDDWHLAQLATVLQLLPYRLFVAVNGGTEGLLPAMRLIFIAGDLALFWYFYLKLRSRRLFGLLAAFFLCADLFAGLLAINYYNFGVHGLAALCTVLFLSDDRPSTPVTVFLGAVLAGVVLTEPSMTAAYLAFGLAVAVRAAAAKKGRPLLERYAFVLNGRVWRDLTVGAGICAAALLIYLTAAVGWKEILRDLPQFFSDSEYGMTWYGNRMNPHKLDVLRTAYGLPALLAAPVLAVLCGIFGKPKTAPRRKAALLVLCLFWLAFCYFRQFMDMESETFKCSSFPVFVFALCAYLLCGEKDRRIFAFWLASLVCSFSVDFVSEVTLLYAGRLCYLPACLACDTLTKELFAPETALPKEKKRRKTPVPAAPGKPVKAVAAAVACLAALLNGTCLFLLMDGGIFADKTQTLSAGPLKGLKNTAAYEQDYMGVLSDMDRIGEDGGTLYVAGMMPICYLYRNDLRNGAYAQWCVERDIIPRQTAYWTSHPEKLPRYVYVPGCLYDFTPWTQAHPQELLQAKYAYIESLGSHTLIEGTMGRIYSFEKRGSE